MCGSSADRESRPELSQFVGHKDIVVSFAETGRTAGFSPTCGSGLKERRPRKGHGSSRLSNTHPIKAAYVWVGALVFPGHCSNERSHGDQAWHRRSAPI
jgi:hypothetical protein